MGPFDYTQLAQDQGLRTVSSPVSGEMQKVTLNFTSPIRGDGHENGDHIARMNDVWLAKDEVRDNVMAEVRRVEKRISRSTFAWWVLVIINLMLIWRLLP